MKINVFIFLFSVYLGLCKQITVSYNEDNDVILYNDKVYTISNSNNTITSPIVLNDNQPILTTGQFWSYALFCLCKISI